MRDRTRRIETGRMSLDVAKYVLTIVGVGGLFSGQFQVGAIIGGIVLGVVLIAIGFAIIPLEGETE